MPVFDSTTLLHLLDPETKASLDPATAEPVVDANARVKFLVKEIEARKEPIVIPTPVLSEVLVHAGSAVADYFGST